MACTASLVPQCCPNIPLHASKKPCFKSQVESSMSIPANYANTTDPNEPVGSEPGDSIPIIDFSLLTSSDPDQRSKIVQDLGKACEEWGFFMVTNHGVGERLMKGVMDACIEFFNLTDEEKREFEGHVLDPIRYGTSANATVDKVFLWRDYLELFVHPHFHSVNKPMGFSELSLEYSKRTRKVAVELVKGISDSLGLEETYIHKALDMDSGLQIFVANLYPPCPQPEHAMGIPPHSDHGILTLLIQNEVGGLQVQHNGKWVNVNPLPNSFLVNTAHHLEILSNGKYKSVLHRAIVNNKATRISLATNHGPSLDAVVGPAMELVNSETRRAACNPMKYKDYLEMKRSKATGVESSLCN